MGFRKWELVSFAASWVDWPGPTPGSCQPATGLSRRSPRASRAAMRTRHSWASLYDIFLASSPKVREKFAHSDFSRQKAARQTSFHAMLTTAKDGAAAPGQNLNDL